MKKTTSTLLLILSTMLFFVFCEKDPTQPEQTTNIAMLAEGITFDDNAFLQNCKEGLERAKSDFDIQTDYNVDTTGTDYQKRMEKCTGGDHDLIIAVGYMWNDAIVELAPKYPKIKFVLVDAELTAPQPNATSILFDVDEAAYPLGYLAAWWADHHDTANPAVGFVGAVEIPQVKQAAEPYLNGVDYYNEKHTKSVDGYGDYAGSFIDENLGGQIADSLISLGADVIFGLGGLTGNGALYRAKERGKWGIGIDVDQSVSIPEVSDILLSCAMKRLDNAVYAVVQSYIENKFSAGDVYTGNLANEGVALAPYHDFESQIPDSVKTMIKSIKLGIINGNISTGW